MNAQSPVTVYRLTDPLHAEIIQNALRVEGIVCEVDGLNQAGLSGVLDIAILTPAADAQRARAIIEQHEQSASRSEAAPELQEENLWDESPSDESPPDEDVA